MHACMHLCTRAPVCICAQEPTLFDRSLEDNIKYGRPAATFEEVRHAAQLANAESFLLALPEGYQVHVVVVVRMPLSPGLVWQP